MTMEADLAVYVEESFHRVNLALETVLQEDSTHVCRDTVESASSNNPNLAVFGRPMILQLHTLQELVFRRATNIRNTNVIDWRSFFSETTITSFN